MLEQLGTLGVREAERVTHERTLLRVDEGERIRTGDPDERAQREVGGLVSGVAPGIVPVSSIGPVRRCLAFHRPRRILAPMIAAADPLWLSLEPDPVIEAYKKDVDRTLLRENLKLTADERVRKMIAALRLVEEIQRSREPR